MLWRGGLEDEERGRGGGTLSLSKASLTGFEERVSAGGGGDDGTDSEVILGFKVRGFGGCSFRSGEGEVGTEVDGSRGGMGFGVDRGGEEGNW